MSQRFLNTGKKTPVRPSAASKTKRVAASVSTGLTPDKKMNLKRKRSSNTEAPNNAIPHYKLPKELQRQSSILDDVLPIAPGISRSIDVDDFRRAVVDDSESEEIEEEEDEEEEEEEESSSASESDADGSSDSSDDNTRESSPVSSIHDGKTFAEEEDFRVDSDDSDESDYENRGVANDNPNIPVIDTATAKVSRMIIKKNWLSLHPNIISLINSVLKLYVEQSIIDSGVHFEEPEQAKVRDIIANLSTPLAKKFKTIRLPPDVSEFQFDEEALQEEKNRLTLSVSANSTQAERLKKDFVEVSGQLHKEVRLLKEFDKAFQREKKKRQKSLKEIERNIKDFGKAGNLPVHTFDNVPVVLAEKINLDFLKEPRNTRKHYDPEEDDSIKNVLSSLKSKVEGIEQNVTSIESLSELIDRVNTLLQLAMET